MTTPDDRADDTPDGIEARGLDVEIDRTPILHDVDLRIRPGAFTAVVGPNGCGKSTFLRTLVRLLRPAGGRVDLDGRDLRAWPARQAARRIALLPQSAQAPAGITVRDLVARGRFPHQSLLRQWSADDERAVSGALAAVGMTDLAERLVDDLSGGQRQRVWIGMVLAQQTEIVLLDEPTTFLDIAHQLEVLELARALVTEQGRTVVAVLHDLQQAARYADELVVLSHGRVVAQGTPDGILTRELLADVFGVQARLLRDEVGGLLVVPYGASPPDLSSVPPAVR
jgi:ABC-type cobalamin/Fe3+-siderophores transport system ATPase subunit